MMKTMIIDGIEYQLIPIEKEEEEKEVYSDWRLPSRMELISFVDDNTYSPASFDEAVKPDLYWSSTTYAYDSDEAWAVDFDDGSSRAYGKSNGGYVRFVRDGTNGLEWSATGSRMTWREAMELASTYEGKVTFRSEK
jgi:hypothetical protein